MKLEGKIFKGNVMWREATVIVDEPQLTFVKELEKALIETCRSLDIPIPMWLSKNTQEFAAFRQTLFFSDQFTEPFPYDRFQIRLL